MITVKDVMQSIEKQAPLSLQESWDNCGLQVGSKKQSVKRVLTALDVTKEVLQEAVEKDIDMIVSHHPFLFKGIKSLDLDSPQGEMIAIALQHSISIYSAHTNLDIAQGGLNDEVATRLGLSQVRGLVETGRDTLYKLVVFVPLSHSSILRQALGDAGAGQLGDYSHCTFSTIGTGQFCPLEGANPYIGERGQLESVEEERIETIVPSSILEHVLSAMKKVHPYEEIAYDVIPLHLDEGQHFIGRIGELEKPFSIKEWLPTLADVFPHRALRFGGVKVDRIERIALCTGSGAEFIKSAAKAGAQVYVTGDVKYHDMQLAKELGIMVVDAGHYGTEYISSFVLKKIIENELSHEGIEVIESDSQRDFFFEL